jgi:sirohydrochlorin ferrochelatase
MNISCVQRDIPQDLTLAAEESSHPPLPHMVVLTIKVWRTRTPVLVRHLWILDWLESRRFVTVFDTN